MSAGSDNKPPSSGPRRDPNPKMTPIMVKAADSFVLSVISDM